MGKRFKITRIEIWEVSTDFLEEPGSLDALDDSIQDDILNSQDIVHETDDGVFQYTPKEMVELKVEEIK